MEEINKKMDRMMLKVQEIDRIMKKMDEMEKSLAKKYDEIKSNIKATMEKQELLNQTMRKLQKDNKAYKDEISDLKGRIEWLEKGNLETSLNLYPVIETERMDLNDLMLKIGNKIGLKIEGRDILDKYRKPTKKSGKPGDIVIKCASKDIRDKIIEGIKKVKLSHEDIGIKCELKRIYGNEELTKQGKDIYYRALKFKYEQKWKFLWIKGGRSYLKKDENGRAIRLDNMEILEQLCK